MSTALTEAPESPAPVVETEVQAPETPGSTDAPVVEVPVSGVAPETPAPASAATRTRDPATGRFVKADGTQVSDAEQATLERAATAAPPLAGASPPPVATSPAAGSSEPFVFRGDGQRYPIPGAVVAADGTLTVPPEQVPAVRQLLAEGVVHRGSWRQREQEFKQSAETASATQTVRAEKYNRAAMVLLDHLENAEWLAAAVADPREIAILKRSLAVDLREADLRAPKGPVAPARTEGTEAQGSDEQLLAGARSVLDEELDLLLEGPEARAFFTPAQRTALQVQYQRRLNAYFVEHEGGVVLDRQVLAEDFRDDLAARKALKSEGDAERKAREFNARRNQPAVPAAPVVSTKGPGGSGTGTARKYTTKEEYEKAMGLR